MVSSTFHVIEVNIALMTSHAGLLLVIFAGVGELSMVSLRICDSS